MWFRVAWLPLSLLVGLAVACTTSRPADDATSSPTPTATPSASSTTSAETSTPSPSATSSATGTQTPTPTATPPTQVVPADIRATRLRIPSLSIDSEIQGSQVVLDTGAVTPGCPPTPPGQETFTVPSYGIATPVNAIEGFEHKIWIFGHSRWLGQAGLFLRLEDISVGDAVLLDGVDRRTGETFAGRRFAVNGLYLTDIQSGGTLVNGLPNTAAQPVVMLQTSVREDGANKQWILNQQKLTAKARNLVEGDINDPCKYLLLFVIAQASP